MTTTALFKKIAQQKIFVIGDVMLDNYWFGYSNRMSPEAPVPIVSLKKKESRLGGALNVAANCIALGAETQILSVIGKDEDGKTLLNLCKKKNIQTKYILQDDSRITTTKARVISGDKHMLRIDNEQTTVLKQQTSYKFISKCMTAIQIEKPDVIILQDYNKGVLTPAVIRNIIKHAKTLNCLVCVDPKLKNFFAYKGVDIFKPNLKEVLEGLGIDKLKINKANLKKVDAQLRKKLKHKVSFITLSENGVFVQQGEHAHWLKAHKRNVMDVSGAGDTVIATAALTYSASNDEVLMASVANIAGGMVCEQVGVVTINKTKLQQEVKQLAH